MQLKALCHILAIFLTSLVISYAAAGPTIATEQEIMRSPGFIFASAIAATLAPLLLVAAVAGLGRLLRKDSPIHFFKWLWGLWIVTWALALYGNMLPIH